MSIRTSVFGYPRIGFRRELKRALEDYWAKRVSKQELLKTAESIVIENAKVILSSGIDLIPCNDFSLYDHVLDHAVIFGAVPERFRIISEPLERYFAMARGTQDLKALEMTKWFNTNYHYIVPEHDGSDFYFEDDKPIREFKLIEDNLSVRSKPVILGAFTFLKLSKIPLHKIEWALGNLFKPYAKLLRELERVHVEELQIDEPALVLELTQTEVRAVVEFYRKLRGEVSLKLYVQTYYDSISNYEELVYGLDVDGVGFDFVDGEQNLINLERHGFPANKVLVAGIVPGRDVWRVKISEVLRLVERIGKHSDKLILTNSCPLFHLPITVEAERGHLRDDLIDELSFANERLRELSLIKATIEGELPDYRIDNSTQGNPQRFGEPLDIPDEKTLIRKPSFHERYRVQLDSLRLPLFPTTTIGSFPQTVELRKVRADYKARRLSQNDYREFIKNEILKAVRIQESLDIDVLVHGEFERADMVEFFAEKLEGFAVTKSGWVQSYGSRCVRPPIIYGAVKRREPLIVEETLYCQSLTNKPVKGILTGAVTILKWSFRRRDIPSREIAYQIALALREEVLELERRGIRIIQIDEPAFKEGMPLKRDRIEEYFDWAIGSFKLVTKDLKAQTQVHTHMCYSEFSDILDKIYALDADVISIEASRSRGEIINAFENFKYDRAIGLGVYDIHSPRIPTVEEITEIIERATRVIDKRLLWVNPDCGLKTRGWEETVRALQNMVNAAKIMRMREVEYV